MSAPESTRSKGRPSLLSETAQGAPDTSSRILASLEGRAVAQPLPRRRSKKPLIIAALAVIGFGALGAWQWQRGQQNESTVAAGTSAARGSAAVAGVDKAPAAAGASGGAAAVVANASGAGAGAAASAPQTAVILADDSVRGDAPASPASRDDTDGDRLARALANGSAPAQPAVAAAVAGGAQSNGKAASATVAAASSASQSTDKRAPGKTVASRAERQPAKGRAAEKLAAARTTKHAKGRAPAMKDDPDADLLAALVARTKPYDPKASRADAAKGASAGPAAKAARPTSDARRASLSERLKACDQGNFFEAQACRWRVCSDHWGKDPACPSTASAAQTR